MRRCLLVPLLVASAAILAWPAAGQPPSAWAAPQGADGHPDLQGVWLNNSATPLERPKALGGRAALTDDEVAELRRRADRLFRNTNADFAAGDAVFLAALADIDRFTSTTSTGTTTEMIERDVARDDDRDDRARFQHPAVVDRRPARRPDPAADAGRTAAANGACGGP